MSELLLVKLKLDGHGGEVDQTYDGELGTKRYLGGTHYTGRRRRIVDRQVIGPLCIGLGRLDVLLLV